LIVVKTMLAVEKGQRRFKTLRTRNKNLSTEWVFCYESQLYSFPSLWDNKRKMCGNFFCIRRNELGKLV